MSEWKVKASHAEAESAESNDVPKTSERALSNGQVPPDVEIQTEKTDLHDLRASIHRQLLERLNLSNLDRMDRAEVNRVITGVVRDLLEEEGIPLNVEERDHLTSQVLDEIFGLGPLQPTEPA